MIIAWIGKICKKISLSGRKTTNVIGQNQKIIEINKEVGIIAQKQNNKISGECYFQMPDREEDKNAKTYWDRIKPTLITAEEYFSTVESKEDWYRRHEEKALSNFYGVPITVEIVKAGA